MKKERIEEKKPTVERSTSFVIKDEMVIVRNILTDTNLIVDEKN